MFSLQDSEFWSRNQEEEQGTPALGSFRAIRATHHHSLQGENALINLGRAPLPFSTLGNARFSEVL